MSAGRSVRRGIKVFCAFPADRTGPYREGTATDVDGTWEGAMAMSEVSLTPPESLPTVRARRAHLHQACQEVEAALAAPLSGRPDEWLAHLAPAVAGLRQAFDAHISITEADDGLFTQIRGDAPRLEPRLHRLHREHTDIAAALATAEDELRSGDPDELEAARDRLTTTLGALIRHRQRGADLLYEAYEVDIGGE